MAMETKIVTENDNKESAKRLENFAHNVAENYFLHFSIRQNVILNKLADKAPQKYLDNLIKIMQSYLYRPNVSNVNIDNSTKNMNAVFADRLFDLKNKVKLIEKAELEGEVVSRNVREDGGTDVIIEMKEV